MYFFYDSLIDAWCALADVAIQRCNLARFCFLLVRTAHSNKRGMLKLAWQLWNLPDDDMYEIVGELVQDLAERRSKRK